MQQLNQEKSPKNLVGELFLFFTTLPHSREKLELEGLIRNLSINKKHNLKQILTMIIAKVRDEVKKEVTTRTKNLKIWAHILEIFKRYAGKDND